MTSSAVSIQCTKLTDERTDRLIQQPTVSTALIRVASRGKNDWSYRHQMTLRNLHGTYFWCRK